jgi:hypothetical protein
MSKWIQFVKSVQADQGVSYKEAMQLAKPLYKKQSGGNLRSTVRKARNTVNRVEKVAKRVNKRADVIGRKAKNTVETVGRKGRNTALRVSEYADEALPVVSAMAPEVGAAMFAVNASVKEALGAGNKRRKRRQLGVKPPPLSSGTSGGSFRVQGGCVQGKCTQCGGAMKSKKESLDLLPSRSLSRLQKTN